MCSIDDIKVLCFMDRRFYTIAIPFLYQYIKCRDLSDHGSILLLKTLARSPRLSNLVQTFQFSSMFRDTLMSVIKLLRTCLRQMHSLVALDLEIPASCRSLFVDTTFRLAEARLSIKYDAYTIQWLETQHALTFLFVSPYSHATQRFTLSPNALPRLSRLYAPARVIADFASGRPLYEAAIRDRFVTPDVPLLEETMRALALSPHPSQVMSLLIFFRVIDVSTLFLAMSRHLSKLEKFVVFTSQFSQVCLRTLGHALALANNCTVDSDGRDNSVPPPLFKSIRTQFSSNRISVVSVYFPGVAIPLASAVSDSAKSPFPVIRYFPTELREKRSMDETGSD
jgi:hypothetical protein